MGERLAWALAQREGAALRPLVMLMGTEEGGAVSYTCTCTHPQASVTHTHLGECLTHTHPGCYTHTHTLD